MVKKQRLLGLALIVPFFAYGIGAYLLQSAEGVGNQATGMLLLLLNVLSVLLIGVLMKQLICGHAIRKSYYLMCRVAEALMLFMGGVVLTGRSMMLEADPALGEVLTFMHTQLYHAGMIVLAFGSILLLPVWRSTTRLPRWSIMWGIAGYALLLTGSVLEQYGFPYSVELSLPGGFFELFLGGKVFLSKKELFLKPENSSTHTLANPTE